MYERRVRSIKPKLKTRGLDLFLFSFFPPVSKVPLPADRKTKSCERKRLVMKQQEMPVKNVWQNDPNQGWRETFFSCQSGIRDLAPSLVEICSCTNKTKKYCAALTLQVSWTQHIHLAQTPSVLHHQSRLALQLQQQEFWSELAGIFTFKEEQKSGTEGFSWWKRRSRWASPRVQSNITAHQDALVHLYCRQSL